MHRVDRIFLQLRLIIAIVCANRVAANFISSLPPPLSSLSSSREENSQNSNYQIVERGHLYDMDYSIYMKGPYGFISPWHDIPLFADKARNLYNMVVEIPRWTNAKMEMTTRESLSPIRQSADKAGRPRFIVNIFPYHGYVCNYGALPQTWEDVSYVDPDTNTTGDGDPIDVLEIGSRTHKTGDVVQVKIVGVLGLLDNGETDWKLIALDASDPLAPQINDILDVKRLLPGLLSTLREWFRIYKTPDGQPPNVFAFGGAFRDAKFARETIEKTHDAWQTLIRDPNPPYNTESHVPEAAHPADDNKWAKIVEDAPALGAPAKLPRVVDEWYYSIDDDDRKATPAMWAAANAPTNNSVLRTLTSGVSLFTLVLIAYATLTLRLRNL